MRILHLGGNDLGDRILAWLRNHEDHVNTVTDLAGLDATEVRDYDWIVSAGFRHVVPASVLELVPHACNVHTSLLPWGRGAHPNVWAIVDHEPSGVTIHRMTPGLDEGPIYAQHEVEFTFGDVASDLHARLKDAAYDLFAATWPQLREGTVAPIPQPAGGSHHRMRELDELVDIDLDATVTWRRALDTLRALTFPPHRNLVVEEDGRSFHVEIRISEVDSP